MKPLKSRWYFNCGSDHGNAEQLVDEDGSPFSGSYN